MQPQFELRAGLPVEIRESETFVRVSGYAAVFNQWADIGGWFMERIAPGAFADSLRSDDCVFLINHEGLPMARTKSGTLKLSEDEKGLYMETELDPDDPDVRLIVPKMRRGDLDKMSFRFTPLRQEWDESGEIPKRTLLAATVSDVSIVTFPAYEGTDIALRSLDLHRTNNPALVAAHIRSTRMRLRHSLSTTLANTK